VQDFRPFPALGQGRAHARTLEQKENIANVAPAAGVPVFGLPTRPAGLARRRALAAEVAALTAERAAPANA
jgi:hypothetical protein